MDGLLTLWLLQKLNPMLNSTSRFSLLRPILLILIIWLVSGTGLTAQVRCATDQAMRDRALADPNYKREIEQMDQQLRDYIAANPGAATVDPNNPTVALYYIPVVVHVIHTGGGVGTSFNPSTASINSTINYMNSVYNGTWPGTIGVGDLQIRFVPATKDPNNAATTGIVRTNGVTALGGTTGTAYGNFGVNRSGSSGVSELTVKNLSRWDPFKYYNLWLVNRIDGCSGIFCGCPCDAGYVAGFAYFPMSDVSSSTTRDLDGTLILATSFNAGEGTLPHELGHAFSVYHPFQGNGAPANNCPANGNPATDGDLVADTDPVTNPSEPPNAVPFACRTGINPCTGTPYTDNTEKNYMNYTTCNNLFTSGQKTRMNASTTATMRASQATSWANNQGTYPTVFLVPSGPTAPVSNLSADVTGIVEVRLNNRSISSLRATQDGGYMDGTKWYNLFELQANVMYSMTVRTVGPNSTQIGVYIDFDNSGTFGNTAPERVYYSDFINGATSAAGVTFSFTVPIAPASGSIVRMRIMQDLASNYIGSAVFNSTSPSLVWGQAEDYPVYLRAAAVPVTVMSFTGFEKDNYASLQWKTASEFNNKGFDLEKSFDGITFNKIAFVAGHRTSTAVNDYRYNERARLSDIQYYRLKQIDLDGKFVYSNTVSIKGRNNKFDIVSVTNPFDDRINMIFSKDPGSMIGVEVIDVTGRRVFSERVASSGSTLSVRVPGLSSGAYLLKVLVNQEVYVRKVVKN